MKHVNLDRQEAASQSLTLSEALRTAAQRACDDHILFLQPDGTEIRWGYSSLWKEANSILSGLRAAGLGSGGRAIVHLEPAQDILAAFWGCVLGGIVPVITPVPPTYDEPNRTTEQLRHVWDVLGQPPVIASRDRSERLGSLWSRSPAVFGRVLAIEDLRVHSPDAPVHQARPDDPLLCTLTSGSTGVPKCILLTHRNVLSRAVGTNVLCGHAADDVILNWLPLDHVASISDWHLRCVLLGCKLVYAPKEYVMSRPLGWLDLVDRHRVTHTWAPNFAYALVNEAMEQLPLSLREKAGVRERRAKAQLPLTPDPSPASGRVEVNALTPDPSPKGRGEKPWDLSCVKAFLSAGETVSARVMQRFLDLLAPCGLSPTAIRPAFGMAEMGSGVTYYSRQGAGGLRVRRVKRSSLAGELAWASEDDPDGVGLVSLGAPIPGVELRIIDAEGNALPEDSVGRLQVRGEPVASGYYGDPAASAAFHADGWFETGDLGLLSDGELFLTGRAKDCVIVRGANYYCGEIEEVVDGIEGVEPSFSAACAVGGAGGDGEKLAVFFHTPLAGDDDLRRLLRRIRREVVHRIGINPDYLLPVERQDIPKTAIGKLQRSLLARRFDAGEFGAVIERLGRLAASDPDGEPPADEGAARGSEIQRRVAEIWKDVLRLDHVSTRDNIFELGGNSLALVQIHSRLVAAFGERLSLVDMFRYPTVAALASRLGDDAGARPWQQGAERAERRREARSAAGADVAVIGLACRFPGADSIGQFWQNLCGGVESITFFSEDEVIAAGVDPELARHPRYVRAGPILDNVEQFDAEFFGYTAREAELMDPQHRLFLECAWEAMEDAGYDPGRCRHSVGVFAAAVLNTYLLNNLRAAGSPGAADRSGPITLSSTAGFQTMVASDKDYLPTRISYKLNLRGPSVNVQTACSSSLVAIHTAAQSLLAGECDMALAGGVSVSVPQKTGYLYEENLLVSPDGHCRAFDAAAQGTVFGNGAGVVVLKRLADAVEDGDRVYAVIRGSAVNNDGAAKVGYFAPSQDGQAAVVAEALAVSGVPADSISFVEAHGTATALGDPIEVAGLSQAFRAQTGRKQFCAIGSVKTNVGHLQIASGVAGFIKTVLALYHERIPPSLHFVRPNPQIRFVDSPFFVNAEPRPWPTGGGPRRAGVNSLGIGGTNAHVILEEAPTAPLPERQSQRPAHLLTLSARNATALVELVDRYARFLAQHQPAPLDDICFTANTGRAQFSHRLAIVAQSLAELRDRLAAFAAGRLSDGVFHGIVEEQGSTDQPVPLTPGPSPASRRGETPHHLAAIWVQGAAIDWAALDHGHARRRTSLPTYPFQRKRYWIEPPSRRPQMGGTDCQSVLHPLLGRRLTSPVIRDEVYESVLEPSSLPLLDDHRFYDTPILPGACELVMVLEALARQRVGWDKQTGAVVGLRSQRVRTATDSGLNNGWPVCEVPPMPCDLVPPYCEECGLTLSDVRFTQAIVVPDGKSRTVQLILSRTSEGDSPVFVERKSGQSPACSQASFQIVSRATDGEPNDGPWSVHATGRVVASSEMPAAAVPRTAPERERFIRASRRRWTGTEFYESMLAHQVALGRSFRLIESAWLGRGEALCRLALPAGQDAQDVYQLHPAVIDAGLQVLGGVQEYDADYTLVPTSIGRFCLLQRPATDRLWCHVRIGGRTADEPGQFTADICLLEDDGSVVATMDAVRYEAVPREVFWRLVGKDSGDLLYRPTWVPRPSRSRLPNGTESRPAGGTYMSHRWLILADRRGFGENLASLLRQRGQEPILVQHAEEYRRQDAGCYAVNPARPEHFRQLIGDVQSPDHGPLRAVVHLWALDGDSLSRSLVLGCASGLHLLQALQDADSAAFPLVCFVTQGAQPVGHQRGAGCQPATTQADWQSAPRHDLAVHQPAQASLWGLGRTIALECPDLDCLRVDLDPGGGSEQAALLLEDLWARDREPEIGFRGSTRYVHRLERYRADVAAAVSIRADATYLIAGGTGALGLQVARWLAERGGRHLALVSRRGASSPESRRAIESLRQEGVHVEIVSADIAQCPEAARALDSIASNMPPLRGVVHAAGVHDDGIVARQTWARFEQVMAAKVVGGWNLHQWLADRPLDFFVAFSSMASILGSPGQASYSAANAAMDALMHYRRTLGLPGLSILWGPWAGVGMAAAMKPSDQQKLQRRGIGFLEVSEALAAMSSLLSVAGILRVPEEMGTGSERKTRSAAMSGGSEVPVPISSAITGAAQVVVGRVDWLRYGRQIQAEAARPLLEWLAPADASADVGALPAGLRQRPAEELPGLLTETVREMVCRLLGMDPAQVLEQDRGFYDLGMDSLSLMQLRNRLQDDLGLALPATVGFQYSDIASLANYLAERIGGREPGAMHSPHPGHHGTWSLSQRERGEIVPPLPPGEGRGEGSPRYRADFPHPLPASQMVSTEPLDDLTEQEIAARLTEELAAIKGADAHG